MAMASQPPTGRRGCWPGPGPASTPIPTDRAAIGWGRAILSGLGLVVLGILVCVYLPNYLVVHLTSWRATRELTWRPSWPSWALR